MRSESMVGVLTMAIAVACAGASSAFGGSKCPSVIHVPKQAATIDAAIAQACPGVPLEIVVAPGSWTMSAEVPGSTALNITIRGAGGGETIVTDEAPGVPLCFAPSGSMAFEIRMKDLTVADVTGSQQWMTFDGCVVRDCVASFLAYSGMTTATRFERCAPVDSYGVLYTGLDIVDCEFVDCTQPVLFWADGPCGARGCTFIGSVGHAVRCYASCCAFGNNIYTFEDCSFTGTAGNAVKLEYTPHPDAPTVRTNFLNCTFTDNVSPSGGLGGGAVRVGITGLAIPLNGNDTETTFTNCTFTGNAAPSGGAIFMAMNHPVILTDCNFAANTATTSRGGAIGEEFGGYGQRLEADGCTFIGNTAPNDAGGALSAVGWYGLMRLDGCTFRDNSARTGGAIIADRNTFVIEDCTFEDNASTLYYGGAVSLNIARKGSGIRRTNFIGNTAASFAGALDLYGYITMPVEDCAFTGNTAGQNGGAMVTNLFVDVDVLRCRFEGNQAVTGSAFYGTSASLSVNLVDCAIADEVTTSATGRPVFATDPGVTVATTTFCASGAEPLSVQVVDAGGNCISEYCTDFDANDVPDACECATNPALPSCCMGDLFNDGAVNAADLAVVLTQWGEKGVGLEADLDGNGIVNGIDLAIVLSNWGECD
jgi:hypothetical protein